MLNVRLTLERHNQLEYQGVQSLRLLARNMVNNNLYISMDDSSGWFHAVNCQVSSYRKVELVHSIAECNSQYLCEEKKERYSHIVVILSDFKIVKKINHMWSFLAIRNNIWHSAMFFYCSRSFCKCFELLSRLHLELLWLWFLYSYEMT